MAERASKQDILRWLLQGCFTVHGDQVFSRAGRQLAQRINVRRRCEHGDARVDLVCEGKRASIHVSHLVWMWNTRSVIPDGFEIHHIDEDCGNNSFSNLLAVHAVDHAKIHALTQEELPF